MKTKPLLISILIFAAVAGGLVLFRSGLFMKESYSKASSEKALYYCPMHPTYTSDKPGDCPICNMKLVKRDETVIASSEGAKQSHDHGLLRQPDGFLAMTDKAKKDICYLHNCPHAREGKPCPMLVVAKEGEAVTCPICGTHIVEKKSPSKSKQILYWTDPMIPGYKSDKPGKSPMGMDLIPVYEEEMPITTSADMPQGYAPILVTPEKQQLIGVKTAPAERRRLIKTIRTVGTIAHDPDLYQAQAEYIQAIKALEQAKRGSIPEVAGQAERLVDSTKIRLKHMGLSDELIQEISAWKEPEHSLLFAHAGEPVWVYAQIYEYELPYIKVGQELAAEVPAISTEEFHGTIRAIDQMVEPMTRTVRVRAVLDNPEGLLKPEMYVNVSLQVDLGEVLVVSNEAVFQTGEKNIVFVSKSQGLFEPHEVTLGAKSEGFQEIKSGIAENEMVVTSGNFLIDSESRLKAALQSAAGGGHQHGA